ncbi:hypothetical protein LWI29_034172 [Acer saccharum]|uniref:Retroviral polymerase SH3-like domain-containing protein n=1 Tax=Acer saccharum TaxID=4024 RepID=A0AA39SSH9_ACESA|nr:hypothetical protein LWI29_034172 [Acer saccharum]
MTARKNQVLLQAKEEEEEETEVEVEAEAAEVKVEVVVISLIFNAIIAITLAIFKHIAAYFHVTKSKLDPRAKKAIFVGFSEGVKGFRLWNYESKKIILSRDVTFDESAMLKQIPRGTENENPNSLQQVEFETPKKSEKASPTVDHPDDEFDDQDEILVETVANQSSVKSWSEFQNQEEVFQPLSVNQVDKIMDRSLIKDMQVFWGVKSDSMNQVDKVMDRSLAKDKQVFGGVKSDSVFSHQVKHKGGNFSEVGGVLSDGSGLFKPKGENIVRKKAVKEVWSTKPHDRSSLSLVEDKAALYSSSSFYESLEEGLSLNFKNFEGEQSCWSTQHGSRKNGPQNERPGCDGLVPFKNLQTVHKGKGFKGFKDFKVGFRKVDGKSLEPSKLKLASPSLPDVGFGSKEKSQEE